MDTTSGKVKYKVYVLWYRASADNGTELDQYVKDALSWGIDLKDIKIEVISGGRATS